MRVKTTKDRIPLYLLLTLLFSSVVWILILNAPDAGRIAGLMFGFGIMWYPALATLVTLKLTDRRIDDLDWGLTKQNTYGEVI